VRLGELVRVSARPVTPASPAGLDRPPLARSGAMYDGDPTSTPTVRVGLSTARAMPSPWLDRTSGASIAHQIRWWR
jgi:hypothetical protein